MKKSSLQSRYQDDPDTAKKTSIANKLCQDSSRIVIDQIIEVETGIFFIGGLYDPGNQVETFGLITTRKQDPLIAFSPPDPSLKVHATLRPVPLDNNANDYTDYIGFVAFLAVKVGKQTRLAMRLHNGKILTSMHPTIPYTGLEATHWDQFWTHSGAALLDLAESALGSNHGFTTALRMVEARQTKGGCPGLVIDQALYAESILLCLYGWSPNPARSVRRLTLIAPGTRLELTERIHRIFRPDLIDTFPALHGDNFGIFALLIVTPEQMRGASLYLETLDGDSMTLSLKPRLVEWSESAHLIRSLWLQALSDLPRLIQQFHIQGQIHIAKRLACLVTELMETHHASLPLVISEPAEQGFFALDHAWALGTGGLLLIGWRFDPYGLRPHIYIHAPDRQSLEITDCLFSVPRPDVAQAYRNRFPDIPEETGLICHIPLPTAPSDVRLIELRSANVQQFPVS